MPIFQLPIPPLIIDNEVAGLTGNTSALSANIVYLYAFASGALPGTTGAIVTNVAVAPGIAALVSGGLA